MDKAHRKRLLRELREINGLLIRGVHAFEDFADLDQQVAWAAVAREVRTRAGVLQSAVDGLPAGSPSREALTIARHSLLGALGEIARNDRAAYRQTLGIFRDAEQLARRLPLD